MLAEGLESKPWGEKFQVEGKLRGFLSLELGGKASWEVRYQQF